MDKRKLLAAGTAVSLLTLLLSTFRPFPGISGVEGSGDGDTPHFPTVSGNNLDRQAYTLPQDFKGELNIVLIAFQQWQQQVVNGWIPEAQAIEAELDGIAYYELPTLWEMGAMRRTFLNEGMRAGIPDPLSRERTITLYLDKEAFKQSLAIPNERTIVTLLVNREGDVLWQAYGEVSEEKLNDLRDAINKNSN